MKNTISITIILLALLFSCGSNDSNSLDEKQVSQYLDELESEYERICKLAGMEVWEFYSDTSKNSMTRYKELFSNFFLNDSIISHINYLNSKSNELSNDTIIKRLDLWENVVTCAQVDFDPDIVKLQNTLETQLSNYPSDDISTDELQESILDLINLRNSIAKQLGYSNYAYLVLQNTGIDTIWFENLIRTIDTSSLAEYNAFVQNHFPDNSNIEYQDLRKYIIQSYMINEEPVIENGNKEKLINETLSNIGIEVSDLPIRFEITELPPGIGGFGNCIDIPNDFRAVAMEELSFYNLLHEIGHGLHWTNVSVDYPVLKGYEWCTGNLNDAYCESMAEIIARFSQNKVWLMDNGFSDSQVDSINASRKEISPLFLRLGLIRTLFEVELYKNPDKDPAGIKSDLYKKYLNINRDFSKIPNLISLAYVSYPIYEQNYLIADIVSWQIHNYLENTYGENYAIDSEVGEFLREKLWKDGELYDWQDRVKRATGKELDLEGYLKNLLE